MKTNIATEKTSAKSVSSDIEGITNYIQKSNIPIKKSEILTKFSHLKIKTISQALSSKEIINLYGYYIHRDMLPITDEDKIHISSLIDTMIKDGYPHHSETLLTILSMKNRELVERLSIDTQSRLFSILKTFFADIYELKRPFFATKGTEIKSTKEILKEFVYENDIISINKILSYAKNNKIAISNVLDLINSYNDEYFLANKQELWKIELTGLDDFKEEYIEGILGKLTSQDGFFVFRNFKMFNAFPKINIDWNEWLLYSTIKKWSKSYKVLTTNNHYKASDVIVVKNEINVNTQNELLSYVSEKNNFSEVDLLRYARSRRLID